MLLTFTQEPELYFNVDEDITIEVYEFDSSKEESFFRLGENFIDFKIFRLELQRKDNDIKKIYMTFPDVEQEKIQRISDYFSMSEDQKKEIKDLKSATLVFSIEEGCIDRYIAPFYDSPQASLRLLSLVDESEEPVLLNFKYYEVEGFN